MPSPVRSTFLLCALLAACGDGAQAKSAAVSTKAEPVAVQAAVAATAAAAPTASAQPAPVPTPSAPLPVAAVEAAPPAPAPSAPTATDAAPTSPEPPALSAVASVHLVRAVLAQAIEAREPVGESSSFPTESKVYVFLEIENKEGEPYALKVRFDREGASKPGTEVLLTVPTLKRYRTQAFFNNTRTPGRYHCILSTEAGEQVSDLAFDVVAGPGTEG